MNPANHHTSILTRIDEISDAARTLLGRSPEAAAVHRELETFRREAIEITGRRGVHGTVIGVVGSKNSGKSWLCRTLILDPNLRERIPSGFNREGATDKLTWIGDELPEDMDPSCEARLPASSVELFDLGCPYMLLDVPGHNEADDKRRETALRSITLAPMRVAMFTWDTLGDESNDVFLAEGDGATILPVIVDPQHPRRDEKAKRQLDNLRRRLSKRCPGSQVLEPVLVPGFEHRPDKPAAEEQAASIVRGAVRRAMESAVANLDGMLLARLNMLRKRLGGVLSPMIARARGPLEKLDQAEKNAAAGVLTHLVGSPEDLQRSLRFRVLWRIASSLPAVLFPFRTFMSVLALATGAIDRLAFAMLGSLPSLALSAFQAVRNVRSLSKRRTNIDHELTARARSLITDEIAPASHAFHRAVQHALPAGESDRLRQARQEIEITGLEVLRAESNKIFEETVAAATPRLRAVSLGVLATIIFWGLAAGPIWALYQAFMIAWRSSFNGIEASIWQTFPVPSPGYVFGSLFMTMLPAFFLAFVACLISAGRSRLAACASAITREHDKLIRHLVSEGRVFFACRDEVRQSFATLLHFMEDRQPEDKVEC